MQTLLAEPLLGHAVGLSQLAEHLGLGHLAVLEHHLGMIVLGAGHEVRVAADAHARCADVDQEQRRLLRPRHRVDDRHRRASMARHEPLLAVDHPLGTLPYGARLQVRSVRACTGLRDGVGRAGRHHVLDRGVEIPLLLLRVAGEQRVVGTPDIAPQVVGRPASLLLCDHLLHDRGAEAAQRLRDVHRPEACFNRSAAQSGADLFREGPPLFDRELVGEELLFRETARP